MLLAYYFTFGTNKDNNNNINTPLFTYKFSQIRTASQTKQTRPAT